MVNFLTVKVLRHRLLRHILNTGRLEMLMQRLYSRLVLCCCCK
ncbi:hypothetical protein GCK32_001663 [Trichostrongylus colubriformis]|uniref:Uncharacterized protein n=1 Tax=Trichostrongylus colubriformis TaxID=6319 RepID=A0AAN8IB37_TRICO